MHALLLAAGVGSRLRPITDTTPKCLVPIHGRPLLDYWFDLLLGTHAIERVLLNTHYLAHQVHRHVEGSRWQSRVDLVHEAELLGTGGTLLANRDYFGSSDFLIAHADNLTDFDPHWLITQHRARMPNVVMTMLAFRTDDPSSCGILECDADGIVQAFHEKVPDPPGNLANGAVYVVTPEIATHAASLGRPIIDLSTEVIPHFLGRILAVETSGYHRDIGNPESLQRAHEEFHPSRP
ncbi:nucleotidyltransferase family protein [Pontivivens ytuae]|uniref:Nucleotidyltransferase family protein n=1 Tax=Pontivivens ytuae TaxID=2789856 RepID=A0A7S9LP03_9RHOB|nr:nucleotidyltransferase family protein [Pontivivens ytuae]QPH52619.1 nucleotidyltransferase family protein [Pontivivens ytuae]